MVLEYSRISREMGLGVLTFLLQERPTLAKLCLPSLSAFSAQDNMKSLLHSPNIYRKQFRVLKVGPIMAELYRSIQGGVNILLNKLKYSSIRWSY
jgi:hypothetical protein